MEEQKKMMMRRAGFDREIERVNRGECPFCGKKIDDAEYRDAESRREREISGLCQKCQDDMFTKK